MAEAVTATEHAQKAAERRAAIASHASAQVRLGAQLLLDAQRDLPSTSATKAAPVAPSSVTSPAIRPQSSLQKAIAREIGNERKPLTDKQIETLSKKRPPPLTDAEVEVMSCQPSDEDLAHSHHQLLRVNQRAQDKVARRARRRRRTEAS